MGLTEGGNCIPTPKRGDSTSHRKLAYWQNQLHLRQSLVVSLSYGRQTWLERLPFLIPAMLSMKHLFYCLVIITNCSYLSHTHNFFSISDLTTRLSPQDQNRDLGNQVVGTLAEDIMCRRLQHCRHRGEEWH